MDSGKAIINSLEYFSNHLEYYMEKSTLSRMVQILSRVSLELSQLISYRILTYHLF